MAGRMSFKGHSSDRMQSPALGFTVDRWWPFTHRVTGQLVGRAEAKRRWDWMRRGEAPSCIKVWKALLTTSQYNCLRLLHEWWNDTIQPARIGRGARKAIAALCKEESSEALGEEKQVLQAKLRCSRYHEQLWHIFFLEFSPEHHSHGLWLARDQLVSLGLEEERSSAMELAAMQRVASAFAKELMSTSSPSSPRMSPCFDSRSSCLSALCSTSHGATLNPCPWLNPKVTQSELPFYLWDVEARQTVETTEIEAPEYICISHTWGRFRICGKSAKLSGTPWLVPCNTKFSVEYLPIQLAKAFEKGYIWIDLLCIPQDRSEIALKEIARQGVIFRNAVSVIAWINDVREWTSLRNTARWISFLYLHQHVEIGYCYGHLLPPDLTDRCFSASRGAAPKEILFSLATPAPNPWLTSLWALQEICLRPDMALCNEQWEPLLAGNDCIVSLDALLVLANYLGSVESAGPSSKTVDFKSDYPSYLEPSPAYAREYNAVIEAIREYEYNELPEVYSFQTSIKALYLIKMRNLSATDIFSLGHLRQVSEKGPTGRAEAVMSAIGAISWYKEFQSQPSSEIEHHLFGLYPMLFVREVARKHPFSFYGGLDFTLDYLEHAVSLGQTPQLIAAGSQVVGSMMPIKPHSISFTAETAKAKYYDACAHVSTQDWYIRCDGSVLIERVARITFGKETPEYSGPNQWLTAPEVVEGTDLCYGTKITLHSGASLRKWLHTFYPSTPNHSICLASPKLVASQKIFCAGLPMIFDSEEFGAHCGILLKEVGVRDGVTVLVKIGTFVIPGGLFSCLIEEDVNWLVL